MHTPTTSAADVYALMRKVYQYQVEHLSPFVQQRNGKKRYLSDIDWERGVFWASVSHIWSHTQDDLYYQGLLNYGLHTGFRPGVRARFADHHVCIPAYLDILDKYSYDPVIVKYQADVLDPMLEQPQPGMVDWYWADALFMAPPSFAALTKVTGDAKYLDYALPRYKEVIDFLFDPETNLVFRDTRFVPNEHDTELREDNDEKVFWSRGIGWIVASVPRMLRYLEPTHPDYGYFTDLLQRILQGCFPYQKPQGYWCVSFLDSEKYPEPETSGTALITFGLAYAYNQGILRNPQVKEMIMRAWEFLQSIVTPEGKVTHVQAPAYHPRHVDPDFSIEYGTAAFLFAANEVAQMLEQ